MRLIKAKATFSELDMLMEGRSYNTALGRLYYACFYATTALLLSKGLTSETHSEVATLLQPHFVKQNTFDVNTAAFFNQLLRQRDINDNNDILIDDKSLVEKFIRPAKEYIDYISTLLTSP